MSRRGVVVLVAVLAVTAGCGGLPTFDSKSADSATPCAATYQPTNPDLPESEVRPIPGRPETLNASTARSLVQQTASAVVFNEQYDPDYERIDVDVRDVSVTATAEGYRVNIDQVEVSTVENTSEGRNVGQNEWSATYRVNESAITRVEASAVGVYSFAHCWNESA